MVTKFTKEKDKDGEKTSPSGSSDSSESGKTEPPEPARRDKSSEVEEVPTGKESKRREREERRDRSKRREREERRARSEPRKERRDRSRSHRKQRRGRSPELRAEPADNRKPAHPKGAPKDRAGSGSKEGSKSKERCPICWQPVSVHQSGKDQHMWSNLVCLTWQMHAAQKPHQKDWSLAKRQAQELKEHRMKKTAEPGAVLVSQATRQAAQKAQDSAAAFLRGKSKASREERTRSGSCSPAKRPTRKGLRRHSPSPSPPRPPKEPRRSPSQSSSSRPRRRKDRSGRRGRQIIINVS